MSAWGDFIERLYGFSLLPTRERRKRRLAIELVLWSALSGLIYSAILVYIDQVDTVYLAIGYVVFSFINLYFYYLFRGYQFFQLSQLVLLLALPILNQFFVGGYVNSGANVVASILAPIGALFFLDHKKGRFLCILMAAGIIGAGVYEWSLGSEPYLVNRQSSVIIMTLTIFITLIIVYFVFEGFVLKANHFQQSLEIEKDKAENLLLNMLPKVISDELQETGKVRAKGFASATVVFSDFVNFSGTTKLLTPGKLVEELDIYFQSFDNIMEKYGLEKIKTIGDNFMFAGGIPEENNTHANDCIAAAIEMQEAVKQIAETGKITFPFQIRIGMHTGPLVAGVVGKKKFTYDIWGDTVNVAARIEQNGTPGHVNISESTYQLTKSNYESKPSDIVDAKNVGKVATYVVIGPKKIN